MTATTSAKRIALVAHDHRKGDLLEWAEYTSPLLGAAGLAHAPLAASRG